MWTKLDDGFPDHPKVTACGPLAAWLYVCGLCYTNRLLTDGFIPAGQLRRLADVPDAVALAEKLCEVGLWEHSEGGYSVHDFHDLNPTAEEVKAHRADVSAKRAEAGRRGMEKRWGDNKITKPITNEYQSDNKPDNKTITPSYTRPDPDRSLTPPIVPPKNGNGVHREVLAIVPKLPKLPPAEQAVIDRLKQAAQDIHTRPLTKAQERTLNGWYNEHKKGLTVEVIEYAERECATHEGGVQLSYLFTVLENQVANPNRVKPLRNGYSNGHGALQAEDIPPDGYSWDKHNGEWVHKGGMPGYGFPYHVKTAAEVEERDEQEWAKYRRAKRNGS